MRADFVVVTISAIVKLGNQRLFAGLTDFVIGKVNLFVGH